MVLLGALIAVASMAGLVQCQIDPADIDKATREQWCISQRSACPLLCLQIPGASETPTYNDCDADTLAYNCVCDNGQSPNASEYSQTIPYYLCTERNNQCVKACPQTDTNCQDQCRTANPCGAQNPTRTNATSTASISATNTLSPTTSSPAPFTGLPDEDAAVRPLTDLTQVYGLTIVLGGFFAGFAILL
ncbi:hypothetical protein BJX63DRAFT_106164 [Aspergillus granulosus]|uniref:DUF7707 domain-containing protein n=1 Tax=Aspergillus granulosus TaxID=176169 RepID=A0ABR4GU57_9EURO